MPRIHCATPRSLRVNRRQIHLTALFTSIINVTEVRLTRAASSGTALHGVGDPGQRIASFAGHLPATKLTPRGLVASANGDLRSHPPQTPGNRQANSPRPPPVAKPPPTPSRRYLGEEFCRELLHADGSPEGPCNSKATIFPRGWPSAYYSRCGGRRPTAVSPDREKSEAAKMLAPGEKDSPIIGIVSFRFEGGPSWNTGLCCLRGWRAVEFC